MEKKKREKGSLNPQASKLPSSWNLTERGENKREMTYKEAALKDHHLKISRAQQYRQNI
jgi:hypothetical protein